MSSPEDQVQLITKGRLDSGFQGLDTLIQPLDAAADIFSKLSPLLIAADALVTAFKFAVQIVLGPILFFMGLVADATGFIHLAAQQVRAKLAEFLALVDFDMAQASYRGPASQFPTAVTAYFTPYNSQTSADNNIHTQPASTDVTAVIIVTPDKTTAISLSPDNFCIPIIRPQISPTLQPVPDSQATFVVAPAVTTTLYAAFALVYKPDTADELETPASPAARAVVNTGQALQITLPAPEPLPPGASPRSRYVYLGTSETTMRRVGALTGDATTLTVTSLPAGTAPLPVGATGQAPPAPNKITNAQIAAEGALGVTWKSTTATAATYRLALFKKRSQERGTGPSTSLSVSLADTGQVFKANETYEFSYSYITYFVDAERPEQPAQEVETTIAAWRRFTVTEPTNGLVLTIPSGAPTDVAVYVRQPDKPDTMYRIQVLTGATNTLVWSPSNFATWFITQPAYPVDPFWDKFKQETVEQTGEVHAFSFSQEGVLKGEYRAAVASLDSEMLSHNIPYDGAKFFETRTKETVLVDFQSDAVFDLQFKTNWLPDAEVDPRIKIRLLTSTGASFFESTLFHADQQRLRSADGVIAQQYALPSGGPVFLAGEPYQLVLELRQRSQLQDSVTITSIVYTPEFFPTRTPQDITVQFVNATQATAAIKISPAWAAVPSGTVVKFKFEARSTVPAAVIFTAELTWTGNAVDPDIGAAIATQQILLTAPNVFTQGSTYEFSVTPFVNNEEFITQRLEAAKTYGTAPALAPSMGILWVLPFLKIFYILNPVKDFLGQVDNVLERAFSVLKETVDKANQRKAGIEGMLKFFDDLLENVRNASTSVQTSTTRLFAFKATFKAALKIGPVYVLKYEGKVSDLGLALTNNDRFAALVDLDPDAEMYATIYLAQGPGRSFVSSLLRG